MTVVRSVLEARSKLSNAPSLVARIRLAARQRPSWWRDEWDDQLLFLAVALIWTAWRWRRDKQVKQRLADVAVPNGIGVTVLCFVLARQRSRDRAWQQASLSLGEVSRSMTAQRLEGAATDAEQLPEPQASVEAPNLHSAETDERLVALSEHVARINAWFIGFAIAFAVIVVCAAAIWAASN